MTEFFNYFSDDEVDIKEVSGSTFEDSSLTMTASSLNSEDKKRYKTEWPTVEKIEKILGFRIRPLTPPPPPKVVEIVKEPVEHVLELGKKGKKSAGKKKDSIKVSARPESSGKSPRSSGNKERGILKSARSNSGKKASKDAEIKKSEEPKTVQIVVESTPKNDQIDANAINNDVVKIALEAPKEIEEIEEVIIELPKSLCPSSLKFSKKLGVKNWIENTQFELSTKTRPLI